MKAKEELSGVGSLVELIKLIIKKLVDHPDDVEVSEVSGDYSVVFEVRVHKEDLGQAIGKKGAIAQAIRTLLAGMSWKDGRLRCILDITNK